MRKRSVQRTFRWPKILSKAARSLAHNGGFVVSDGPARMDAHAVGVNMETSCFLSLQFRRAAGGAFLLQLRRPFDDDDDLGDEDATPKPKSNWRKSRVEKIEKAN